MSVERERPFLVDPDNPEYIKDLQRPAVIKEDLTEMERRKRVQQVLESQSFLKELEKVIVQEALANRSEPEQLKLIHRLSELTSATGTGNLTKLRGSGFSPIIISDLRDNQTYSKQEKYLRNKLASCCRLIDMFSWACGLQNNVTLRLPGETEEFFVNPRGLLFQEVTASSLLRISLDGTISDPGSTRSGVSQSAFALHGAVHRECGSAQCIIQLHVAVVAAVASMQCGLLNLCQEAMALGPVKCIDLQSEDSNDGIFEIIEHLRNANVVLLRNRGFLVAGRSVEETMWLAHQTVVACETQIRASKAGLTNLVLPNEETVRKAYDSARSCDFVGSHDRESQLQWKTGELEWEAWMRLLDHMGLRTGHLYRQPHLRPRSQMSDSVISYSDIAEPPTSSALGLLDESDYESLLAHKVAQMRREQEKARWLNSPNAYQRIEILETGTDCPKRITKWVQDPTSPSANGTPIKICSPHQFSPMSSNPKEFKDKQKMIKESRRSGVTSAGPQSQILDGVTYEELSLIRPDIDGIVGQTDRAILIGTASKGIIDRQHQHNAQVYRQLYAPNPFAIETDEGIKQYMQEVQKKSRSSSAGDRARSPSTGGDDTSLMQEIRLRRDEDATRTSTSMYELDADISSSRMGPPQATSTPLSEKRKSKSDRPPKDQTNTLNISATSNTTSTTDDTPHSERSKKKKKGFFSFMKKKDSSST